MEHTSRRSVVITAVIALCISIFVSSYFTYKQKQELKKNSEDALRKFRSRPAVPNPSSHSKGSNIADNSRYKKNGWGTMLLPVYSFGILFYILYIIWKQLSKKRSNLENSHTAKSSWRKQRFKGNPKTKITLQKLRQLELRLQETEEAVQQIFDQTCAVNSATAIVDGYSGSEEPGPKKRTKLLPITDSNSSDEDQEMEIRKLHKRKIRKRSRIPTVKEHCSTDSEPRNKFSSFEEYSSNSAAGVSSDDGMTKKNSDKVKTKALADQAELINCAKCVKESVSELQFYIQEKRLMSKVHNE